MKNKHRNGTRYCPICGGELIKWGKARKFQRWRCSNCGKTFSLGKKIKKSKEKLKAIKILFEYALNHKRKIDYGLSYYKITKLINPIIKNINLDFPNDPGPYDVVYIDGIRFKPWCVLIARNNEAVIGYEFVEHENSTTWSRFLSRFIAPKFVVCDGQKGLLKAIKSLWPCTKVQRCLFHVWMNIRTKLTMHPETRAGQTLLKIGLNLLSVSTIEGKDKWLNNYNSWNIEHNDFLMERTVNNITGEVSFKHERLKSAVYNLDKLIKTNTLFGYLDVDYVSAYNNLLEGGINSPLRDLVKSHRGANKVLQKVIIQIYLLKRSNYWKIITDKLYKNKK